MIWCEHCRDHYPEYHYPEGKHLVGMAYGPTGRELVAESLLRLIFSSGEWLDIPRPGVLVFDGKVEINEEQEDWIRTFWEEIDAQGHDHPL